MTRDHNMAKRVRERMRLLGERYSEAKKAILGRSRALDLGAILEVLAETARSTPHGIDLSEVIEILKLIQKEPFAAHHIQEGFTNIQASKDSYPSWMKTFVAPPLGTPCIPGTEFPLLTRNAPDPEGRLCNDCTPFHVWDEDDGYQWSHRNWAVRCKACGIRRLQWPGFNGGGAASHWSKTGGMPPGRVANNQARKQADLRQG